MEVVHALDDARVLGLDDDEDAGRDALADGEVDDALPVEDAAVLACGISTLTIWSRSALGPCMPGTSGTRPVALAMQRHLDHGLGAIDELDQHARVHVPARRFLAIVVGDGVAVEGVVLALAGGDDAVAERGGELDQLHAGADGSSPAPTE